MTKLDMLRKYLEMANYNFFQYSRNYLMNEPKKGFEGEWEDALAEIKILEGMIAELEVRYE
jgi:hypothetical protein